VPDTALAVFAARMTAFQQKIQRRSMSLVRVGAVLSTVAASALVLSAAPASATSAAGPTLDSAAAQSVALGVSAVKSYVVEVHATGATSVSVRSERTTAGVCAPFGDDRLDRADGGWWGADFELAPRDFVGFGDNGCAGRWKVTFTAKDAAGATRTATAYHSIRRQARFVGLNASPEPVRKGATVTITGKLERANWADQEYHGYAGRTAELQFRTPDGAYSTVKQVVGSRTGTYRATASQARKGCWRLVFRGSGSTTSAKAAGDCVGVR
jgi:hypothetical protein